MSSTSCSPSAAVLAVDGSVSHQALNSHPNIRKWRVFDWRSEETYFLRRSQGTWKRVNTLAKSTPSGPYFIQERGWWSITINPVDHPTFGEHVIACRQQQQWWRRTLSLALGFLWLGRSFHMPSVNNNSLARAALPLVGGLQWSALVAAISTRAQSVEGTTPVVKRDISDEFQINTLTIGRQRDADLTALSDGGFVVTWSSYPADISKRRAYGQKFDPVGQKVGLEFPITFEDNIYSGRVTALPDGGFIVTHVVDEPGNNYSLYAQRFSSRGRVGGIVPIIGPNQGNAYGPAVATLDSGFVVTWLDVHSNPADPPYSLYGQLFDADAQNTTDEFLVSNATNFNQW